MNTFENCGIHVMGSGEEVRTLCPKCSATRKKKTEKCLAVNTIEGCWFCHHCGFSGSLKSGSQKTFDSPETKLPGNIIAWFESRGIPEGILSQERVGFESSGGKNWIRFPYFYNSVCVNNKYRTSTKDWRQEKGGKKCLYRIDKLKTSKQEILVITEGEMDALSILVAGFEATSIPDGAPSPNAKTFNTKFNFLENTKELFESFPKIIIAGDNDAPGKALVKELARRIGYEKCFVAEYPNDCKDPNDVLVKHGKEKLKKVLDSAIPYPIEGIIAPLDCLDALLFEYQNGTTGGEVTGWGSLDEFYTVRVGEMTIVTGMPGSGKSNFVDALCLNLASQKDWRFALFSPENWPVQRHMITLLEKVLGKSFHGSPYCKERMTVVDLSEATKYIHEHIRFIVPKDESLTVDTILKYAKINCLQHGIKGLVIDPWNEIEHDQKNGEREDQYISRQLTKIRRFARFNDLHIWVVAHPTKLHKNTNGNYDPPTMYDISGGANWRNKADNGICVYRDFETNLVKIIIQKIRFREIGKLGATDLRYTGSGNYKEAWDQ